MKIKSKMLTYILSTTMLIFVVAIGFITWKSSQLALRDAREIASKNAQEFANVIKSELKSDFYITKTLAQAGQAFQTIPWDKWNETFLEQQLNVINENPHFLAVATSWELNHIDSDWDKPFGRYLNGWVKDQSGKINQLEARLNTDGDDITGNYYKMKSSGISMIVDPKLYSPTGKVEDQYLNSNISVPIKSGNTFIGLAGVDVDLQRFQEIIESIKPFEGSFSFLLSNDGTFVAHPNLELMGKLFPEIFPDLNREYKIDGKVKKGKEFSFTYKDKNGQKFFYVFASINIEGIDTPWSLAIVVPNNVITSKAKSILYKALFVGLIGLILLTIVVWMIANNFTTPIISVTEKLKSLAQGKIDESLIMDVVSKDEVGEMTLALNTSIEGLNKKTEFANQIGSGNIDTGLELLSKYDELGKSLVNMQNSLQKARKEEESRKNEDEKRRWANEGLAKFADILRQNNDNLETLSRIIIKNLVYYLKANQGGLFIINEQDGSKPTFNLLAAFAFDREKFLKKQVESGEGLVGACAIEKQTIHLTEIPRNYIRITSGMGGANPKSLLLVPLTIENDILGVIEMASFNDFEPHEIEFAEKVAESIASTLRSVRINIKTTQLLEQSQQQSEEMAAQEEEMRQNMEELQATQEESSRKGEEFKGVLDAMDYFLLKAEFDMNFALQNANELFLHKFEYSVDNIIGIKAEDFVAKRDISKFQNILNKVMSGQTHQEITYLKSKSGKELKLVTSFTPVFIKDEIDKILLLALDVNDY